MILKTSKLFLLCKLVDNYEQAAREGWVLGLWGPPGSGKTFLTVATAIECIYRYWLSPLFSTFRQS